MAESMDLVEMERRITFPGSGKLSCISEAGILVLKTDTFARCIVGGCPQATVLRRVSPA